MEGIVIVVWYALSFLFSSVGFALVVLVPLVIGAVLQARKRGGWWWMLAGVMVVSWVAAVVLMVTWEFIF